MTTELSYRARNLGPMDSGKEMNNAQKTRKKA